MPALMLLHITAMVIAAVLIVMAAGIARRKKENWFLRHRRFALSGVAAALLGFVLMFVFKLSSGFPHFKSIHALAGAIALALLIATPVFGMLVVSGKNGLRPAHRVLGRITSLVVVLVALLGLLRFIQILKR